MKKEDYSLKGLKKEVGERLKKFRLDKKKSQDILASELMVHQSTVTNIEKGGTFPKVNYLRYFFDKYALSTNWVVAGEGERYLDMEDSGYKGSSRIQEPRPKYDSQPDQYQELYTLMKIPTIEQVMFAKLAECKILFKKDVKNFYEQLEKEKREKQQKAARAKLRK